MRFHTVVTGAEQTLRQQQLQLLIMLTRHRASAVLENMKGVLWAGIARDTI